LTSSLVPNDRLQADLDAVMREDWGRLLAVLIGDLRDFQLAEDALADAFASALEHWPRGRPHNPQGWLLQVARRKAIDRIRRRTTRTKSQPDLAYLRALDADEVADAHDIPDERLRLMFTACHPSLAPKTRVALTLRTLCGLTTSEIARAFLDKESAMAQRLARAKTKIAKAGIPYVVPDADAFAPRLSSVLHSIYLIFNEGHSASAGDAPVRAGLCDEAIRLGRALVELCPQETETAGLLALMLLHHARSAARVDDDGIAVALEHQDRSRWNTQMAREGLALVELALRRGRPGPFQLQAAISAIHVEAPDFASTPWTEIALIYERLLEMTDSPVVAVNHAVAVSYAHSPGAGLALLPRHLDGYQPLYAARADMLRRLGRNDAARSAYQQALSLTTNASDRAFLQRRVDEMVDE